MNVAVNSCYYPNVEIVALDISEPVIVDLRALESLKPLGTHLNISNMQIQNLTNVNVSEPQTSLCKIKNCPFLF